MDGGEWLQTQIAEWMRRDLGALESLREEVRGAREELENIQDALEKRDIDPLDAIRTAIIDIKQDLRRAGDQLDSIYASSREIRRRLRTQEGLTG